ncbi:MAG: YdeI/OmpD-associated family protein [Chloroflexi bacterium]|nr:YdeI/OmpD-associated family protein [Chloroflexota bacterium]
MPEITKRFSPKTRADWRAWLAKNHAGEKEIWFVIYKKHTGKPCCSYDDGVEEALCFGWIDGLTKRIDDEKYAIRFTPRRSGAVWSESNKKRVAKMIEQGLMMPIGLAKIEEAKKNGEWDKASHREDTSNVPADLKRALRANKQAQKNFEAMPASQKRMFIVFVSSAKRDETRQRRIKQAIQMLKENQKFGIETRMENKR